MLEPSKYDFKLQVHPFEEAELHWLPLKELCNSPASNKKPEIDFEEFATHPLVVKHVYVLSPNGPQNRDSI